MLHRSLLLLILPLLPVDLASQDDRRGRGRFNRTNRAQALEHGRFIEATFHSGSLGQRARYGVYLPVDYDPEGDRRYPLVVWLHGMRNDYRRFHTGGGTAVLDRLIGSGELAPLILVAADGGNSFYINGKSSGKYEDLITVDLLAEIESRYRVEPAREMRGIMGISMGGMGALKIALNKPELFGSVAAHSSAILPANPDDLPPRYSQMLWGRYGDQMFGDPMDVEMWRRENPMSLASTVDPASLDGLRIYFDAGTADRYQFHAANQTLHRTLESREIRHTWVSIPDGGHGWSSGFPMEALERSLRFVGEAFRAAKNPPRER